MLGSLSGKFRGKKGQVASPLSDPSSLTFSGLAINSIAPHSRVLANSITPAEHAAICSLVTTLFNDPSTDLTALLGGPSTRDTLARGVFAAAAAVLAAPGVQLMGTSTRWADGVPVPTILPASTAVGMCARELVLAAQMLALLLPPSVAPGLVGTLPAALARRMADGASNSSESASTVVPLQRMLTLFVSAEYYTPVLASSLLELAAAGVAAPNTAHGSAILTAIGSLASAPSVVRSYPPDTVAALARLFLERGVWAGGRGDVAAARFVGIGAGFLCRGAHMPQSPGGRHERDEIDDDSRLLNLLPTITPESLRLIIAVSADAPEVVPDAVIMLERLAAVVHAVRASDAYETAVSETAIAGILTGVVDGVVHIGEHDKAVLAACTVLCAAVAEHPHPTSVQAACTVLPSLISAISRAPAEFRGHVTTMCLAVLGLAPRNAVLRLITSASSPEVVLCVLDDVLVAHPRPQAVGFALRALWPEHSWQEHEQESEGSAGSDLINYAISHATYLLDHDMLTLTYRVLAALLRARGRVTPGPIINALAACPACTPEADSATSLLSSAVLDACNLDELVSYLTSAPLAPRACGVLALATSRVQRAAPNLDRLYNALEQNNLSESQKALAVTVIAQTCTLTPTIVSTVAAAVAAAAATATCPATLWPWLHACLGPASALIHAPDHAIGGLLDALVQPPLPLPAGARPAYPALAPVLTAVITSVSSEVLEAAAPVLERFLRKCRLAAAALATPALVSAAGSRGPLMLRVAARLSPFAPKTAPELIRTVLSPSADPSVRAVFPLLAGAALNPRALLDCSSAHLSPDVVLGITDPSPAIAHYQLLPSLPLQRVTNQHGGFALVVGLGGTGVAPAGRIALAGVMDIIFASRTAGQLTVEVVLNSGGRINPITIARDASHVFISLETGKGGKVRVRTSGAVPGYGEVSLGDQSSSFMPSTVKVTVAMPALTDLHILAGTGILDHPRKITPLYGNNRAPPTPIELAAAAPAAAPLATFTPALAGVLPNSAIAAFEREARQLSLDLAPDVLIGAPSLPPPCHSQLLAEITRAGDGLTVPTGGDLVLLSSATAAVPFALVPVGAEKAVLVVQTPPLAAAGDATNVLLTGLALANNDEALAAAIHAIETAAGSIPELLANNTFFADIATFLFERSCTRASDDIIIRFCALLIPARPRPHALPRLSGGASPLCRLLSAQVERGIAGDARGWHVAGLILDEIVSAHQADSTLLRVLEVHGLITVVCEHLRYDSSQAARRAGIAVLELAIAGGLLPESCDTISDLFMSLASSEHRSVVTSAVLSGVVAARASNGPPALPLDLLLTVLLCLPVEAPETQVVAALVLVLYSTNPTDQLPASQLRSAALSESATAAVLLAAAAASYTPTLVQMMWNHICGHDLLTSLSIRPPGMRAGLPALATDIPSLAPPASAPTGGRTAFISVLFAGMRIHVQHTIQALLSGEPADPATDALLQAAPALAAALAPGDAASLVQELVLVLATYLQAAAAAGVDVDVAVTAALPTQIVETITAICVPLTPTSPVSDGLLPLHRLQAGLESLPAAAPAVSRTISRLLVVHVTAALALVGFSGPSLRPPPCPDTPPPCVSTFAGSDATPPPPPTPAPAAADPAAPAAAPAAAPELVLDEAFLWLQLPGSALDSAGPLIDLLVDVLWAELPGQVRDATWQAALKLVFRLLSILHMRSSGATSPDPAFRGTPAAHRAVRSAAVRLIVWAAKDADTTILGELLGAAAAPSVAQYLFARDDGALPNSELATVFSFILPTLAPPPPMHRHPIDPAAAPPPQPTFTSTCVDRAAAFIAHAMHAAQRAAVTVLGHMITAPVGSVTPLALNSLDGGRCAAANALVERLSSCANEVSTCPPLATLAPAFFVYRGVIIAYEHSHTIQHSLQRETTAASAFASRYRISVAGTELRAAANGHSAAAARAATRTVCDTSAELATVATLARAASATLWAQVVRTLTAQGAVFGPAPAGDGRDTFTAGEVCGPLAAAPGVEYPVAGHYKPGPGARLHVDLDAAEPLSPTLSLKYLPDPASPVAAPITRELLNGLAAAPIADSAVEAAFAAAHARRNDAEWPPAAAPHFGGLRAVAPSVRTISGVATTFAASEIAPGPVLAVIPAARAMGRLEYRAGVFLLTSSASTFVAGVHPAIISRNDPSQVNRHMIIVPVTPLLAMAAAGTVCPDSIRNAAHGTRATSDGVRANAAAGNPASACVDRLPLFSARLRAPNSPSFPLSFTLLPSDSCFITAPTAATVSSLTPFDPTPTLPGTRWLLPFDPFTDSLSFPHMATTLVTRALSGGRPTALQLLGANTARAPLFIVCLDRPGLCTSASGVSYPLEMLPDSSLAVREQLVRTIVPGSVVTGLHAVTRKVDDALAVDDEDRSQRLLSKRQDTIVSAWRAGRISNLAYISALNFLSGRSQCELPAFPIAPWIISDYTSDIIDLSQPDVFRPLTRSMPALSVTRLDEIVTRFDAEVELAREMTSRRAAAAAAAAAQLSGNVGGANNGGLVNRRYPVDLVPTKIPGLMPAYYSNPACVLLFLMRTEPFLAQHVAFQSGKVDHADRLLSSLSACWAAAAGGCRTDFREAVFALYTTPEIYINNNRADLGVRQSGWPVANVELPPWAHHSPVRAADTLAVAFEAPHVSKTLGAWIDLIFGWQQRGAAALAAANLAQPSAYPAETKVPDADAAGLVVQATLCGFVPRQLFTSPHPPRAALYAPGLQRAWWVNAGQLCAKAVLPPGTYPANAQIAFTIRRNFAVNGVVHMESLELLFDSRYDDVSGEFSNGGTVAILPAISTVLTSSETSLVVSGVGSTLVFTPSEHHISARQPTRPPIASENMRVPGHVLAVAAHTAGVVAVTATGQVVHVRAVPQPVIAATTHVIGASCVACDRRGALAAIGDVAGRLTLLSLVGAGHVANNVSVIALDAPVTNVTFVASDRVVVTSTSAISVHTIGGLCYASVSIADVVEPHSGIPLSTLCGEITALADGAAPSHTEVKVFLTGHANGYVVAWEVRPPKPGVCGGDFPAHCIVPVAIVHTALSAHVTSVTVAPDYSTIIVLLANGALVRVSQGAMLGGEGVKAPPTPVCAVCKDQFGVGNKKVACALCGGFVCDGCCGNVAANPRLGLATPKRVCDHCYETKCKTEERKFCGQYV